jgi:DNA-binding NtrC family response regulator
LLQLEETLGQDSSLLWVLMVGDEVGTMEEVSTYLERGGYHVTVARDGKSAQEASSPAPALAIIDGRLRDMDGLDLIEPLQAVAPSTPIILITAWPNPVLYTKAMERGAAACLSRPVNLWSFGIILQQILRSTWMPGGRPWMRRQVFRVALEFPAVVHRREGDEKLHGQLRDLSHAGAMVVLPGRLATGQAVALEFGPPDQPVRLETSVVWNREDALQSGIYLHGLRFVELQPLEFAYEFARRLAPLPRRPVAEEVG